MFGLERIWGLVALRHGCLGRTLRSTQPETYRHTAGYQLFLAPVTCRSETHLNGEQ